MNTARLLLILSFISFVTISVISGTGCANIVPPAGGPIDSLAPRLEKVSPPDSSLNFRENRINFTFDEYIALQNTYQELLISPTPRIMPSVESRLNTMTVKLKDSLEPNTTYTFQFGNAIKDINESNVLKNFTYTFSTGPYIDSLELRGNVVLAETGRIDSTLVVMLHTNPADSAVVNEKPRYVTKLDNRGNFVFKNLPPKTYYVYALKDESSTRRYFDEKQLFAFAGSAVIASDTAPAVTLYAYSTRPAVATPAGSSAGSRLRSTTTNDRRLKFNTNLVSNQQDLLGNLDINFEAPLRLFDSTKINLYTDSNYTPATSYRIVKDSTNQKLTLVHAWKENTSYQLILDKDFAEDSIGRKLLKTDTLAFKTKKLADYGQVKIRLRNLDLTKNPVLLFVLQGNVVKSVPMAGPEMTEPLFLPGEYELRLLYDDNKNGKWDPGEFFGKRKQPELVKPIDRKINVKANWENEFEITL